MLSGKPVPPSHAQGANDATRHHRRTRRVNHYHLEGLTMNTKYGAIATCKYCNQDIQFLGGRNNWRDRGNNRQCCPFIKKGEIVRPKTKHAASRG